MQFVATLDTLSHATDPRVAILMQEHDDLDGAIAAVLAVGTADDLLVSRLKKRKLQLKDAIALAQAPITPVTVAALAG